MLKLYLLIPVDTEFDNMLPKLLVAESEKQAREIFLETLDEVDRKFIYDFDVDEVKEVGGYEIKINKVAKPCSESIIRAFKGCDIVRFSCPACKKGIEPTYKYCPECGVKIAWRDVDE